jgi:hypothetical protein
MGLKDLLKNIKHNRDLRRSGQEDPTEVRSTTVGWRPDPINKGDGFTPDPGNERTSLDGNGTEQYDTPSGNREYYQVIRPSKRKGK